MTSRTQRLRSVVKSTPPLLQLYVEKALLEEAQPGGFDTIKTTIDVGDIIGVSGGLKRTDKGELSVMVASVQVSDQQLLVELKELFSIDMQATNTPQHAAQQALIRSSWSYLL
jgi:lysyl-tRNA synthetase class II